MHTFNFLVTIGVISNQERIFPEMLEMLLQQNVIKKEVSRNPPSRYLIEGGDLISLFFCRTKKFCQKVELLLSLTLTFLHFITSSSNRKIQVYNNNTCLFFKVNYVMKLRFDNVKIPKFQEKYIFDYVLRQLSPKKHIYQK